jgi:Chaperone of endosialidase
MKIPKIFLFTLLFTLTFVGLQVTAAGQSNERLANMTAGGSSVRLDVMVSNSGSTLTISAPDGRTFRREFKTGASPEFSIIDSAGERLPDGVYTYELRLTSTATLGGLGKMRLSRPRDDDSETERTSRKRLNAPNLVQSGNFAIVNGSVIVAGAIEDGRRTASAIAPQRLKEMKVANTLARLRNHHRFAGPRPDDVIPDDLIVQGSACVGLDCVDGEVFGFDTIRMKENNTRLQFDDTSTSQGFPTNNWQIRANDQASGGGSFLGIIDQGSTGNSETGTIIGRFDAGAPANSLRVASNGKIGLRTATPVLDVHMNTSDTPAIRLEQNNTGGFSAQTWDIAGNEANFFVRDVTGGSLLPFRIRPGAPTSSIDIAADGDVGVGTGSPAAELNLLRNQAGATEFRIDNTNAAGFAGAYFNGGFSGSTGGFVQWNNTTGAENLFVATATAKPLHFGTDNTVRMTVVQTTGRVGIGTTAPDQLFSVNGDASKVGGGSWQSFSDVRLKNIRGKFSTGLNAVMRLQPLLYEYKSNNPLGLQSRGVHVGFGAQDLLKVIPEAVSVNDSGYLMVNNDPILWTMLNAIKEQQKEIAELKGQVRKLQRVAYRRAK